MLTIAEYIESTRQKINSAAVKAKKCKQDIQLLAVSKTKPEQAIIEAYQAGQRQFAEWRAHLSLDSTLHCLGQRH